MDFKQTASSIIELVGGVDNIASIQHCATRLRLGLKDRSLVKEDELKELELVKGINDSGGQFQIILGTGIVNKVYKEATANFAIPDSGSGSAVELKGGNSIQRISRIFGDIFLPVIPVIVACGVLMGVRSYLTGAGLLATDSAWYQVLLILIDTGFSILPALVCYSSVKKFGGSPIYGFVLGMMLLSSVLPGAGAVGKGNAVPLAVPFLSFTFKLVGYQGSVLVAIFSGWLVAKIESLVQRIVPNTVDIIFTPILTLSCSLFIVLFGVGPVIQFIESIIVKMFQAIITLPLGIGGFVIGGLQQFLVIGGVHHGLWVIDINFLENTGGNIYMAIRSASVVGQAGVVSAFFLFSKDKKLKALAGAAAVAAWFGITEPAIFGITLIYGVPFVLGCIGAAFGGLFVSLMGIAANGMGVSAIPGYLLFINDGALQYTIMMLISGGISLVLTAIYIKRKGL